MMYEKGKQMNKQYNALGRNLIMLAMLSVMSENGEVVYAQAHPVSRCRGNLFSRKMLPILEDYTTALRLNVTNGKYQVSMRC